MMTDQAQTSLDYLKQKQRLINQLLDKYLPSAKTFPQKLHQAIRYSALADGKRLRPILVLTGYECFGGRDENIINPAACAVELIHTYSLIHDDLPCMDDDNLRRGMPTLHKKFDEATAVLAGDALHDLAFGLIARTGSTRVVSELADAIGTSGMLGGQMADIQAEGKKINHEDIFYIHSHKTGALIKASVKIGAILAGVEKPALEKISLYGEKIGFAFQIIDDILDIEGDQKKLGKQVGSDCKNLKATYPGTVGMDQARKDAEILIDEAIEVSHQLGVECDHFDFIARYIGRREY